MSRRKSVASEGHYTGVKVVETKAGTHFDARIKHEGKTCNLGSFDSAEEAARAYDRKKLELKGPEAKLNFPIEDYQGGKPEKKAGRRASLPAAKPAASSAAATPKPSSRRKSVAAVVLSPEVKQAAKVPIDDDDSSSPSPTKRTPKNPSTTRGAEEDNAGGWGWVVFLICAILGLAVAFPKSVPPMARGPFESARPHFVRGLAPAVKMGGDISEQLQGLMNFNLDFSCVTDLLKGGGAAASCAKAVDAEALAKMVDKSATWQLWAHETADAVTKQGDSSASGAPKALAVLLTSPSAGSKAAKAMAVPFASCKERGCLLELDGDNYSAESGDVAEARGQLQSDLSAFLARCPAGVVLLTDLQALHRGTVPALLPLLSEQGQYMRDGEGVPAWRATVLLHLKASDLPASDGEEAFAHAAKAQLEAVFGADGGGEEAAAAALALRRRIDLVGPMRKTKKRTPSRTPGMP